MAPFQETLAYQDEAEHNRIFPVANPPAPPELTEPIQRQKGDTLEVMRVGSRAPGSAQNLRSGLSFGELANHKVDNSPPANQPRSPGSGLTRQDLEREISKMKEELAYHKVDKSPPDHPEQNSLDSMITSVQEARLLANQAAHHIPFINEGRDSPR